MKRILRILMLVGVVVLTMPRGHAFGLNLDSIAAWGKFPRFCVNTYRWGDRTFNSYDTLYVQGTGTKFNVKAKVDSWLDYYRFDMPTDEIMELRSKPSTSLGFWVTYLAVSVGYDINVSKYFGWGEQARKRWNFQFNCALFAAELYFVSNDVGTTITRFGSDKNHYDFRGINTSWWGLDAYYFINHRHYSHAAAFNYSKLQRRSQGSFFVGFSYLNQDFDFNFASLPEELRNRIPQSWINYTYMARTQHYSLKLGYGYNWALGKWTVAVSEAPLIGIRRGFVGDEDQHKNATHLSINNRLRTSAVFNNGNWFLGMQGNADIYLLHDNESSLMTSTFSFEASIGYRFNLW